MEEAICTLLCAKIIIHTLMCAEIIIHTLMCVKIIIHTFNVCGNNYSHIGGGMIL